MVRSLGAQVGLLAFGVAILAGLYAGNTAVTVICRALVVMLAGCALGQVVGWIGKLVVRDHLQRKKLAIDREHQAAVGAENHASATPPASGPAAGRAAAAEGGA